jgi:DNA helicase-2/ATP-dependent DNA helicase PcrA
VNAFDNGGPADAEDILIIDPLPRFTIYSPKTWQPKNVPVNCESSIEYHSSSESSKNTGTNLEIKVGYNVEHDRFGKGKVTKIEGTEADKKATIFFPHHGSKTVILRFANLKILEE